MVVNIKVHKRRGHRWTVIVHLDWNNNEEDPVFAWLTENFGQEDFEHGPWAAVYEGLSYVRYDITDKKIMSMLSLRWA